MEGLAGLETHVGAESAVLGTEAQCPLEPPKPWRMRRWRGGGGGREAAQSGEQREASSPSSSFSSSSPSSFMAAYEEKQTERRMRRMEAALSAARRGLQSLLREAAERGAMGAMRVCYYADSDQPCCKAEDGPNEERGKEEEEEEEEEEEFKDAEEAEDDVGLLVNSRRASPLRAVSYSCSSSESLPSLHPPANESGSPSETSEWLPEIVRESPKKRALVDLDEGERTETGGRGGGGGGGGEAKRIRVG